MAHHIGQAKVHGQGDVLVAGFHHAHMGHEGARHVEGRKLDAVAVLLDYIEQRSGNALGGLPLVVAGEHAVDVRVVDGPEALADVHGVGVDAGDHQDLVSRLQPPGLLEGRQPADQPGAAVQLLVLVAAHGPHNAQRLLPLAEGEARDAEIVPVEGVNLVQHLTLHSGRPPPAASGPSASPDPPAGIPGW